MAPQLVYGTATFGMDKTEFQDAEAVKKMLQTAQSLGIKRLDTAPRYPPLSPGRAEQLLGEAAEITKDFIVDTKVFTDTATDGSGDLAHEAMQTSVNSSLGRLERPSGVGVLYAHRADPSTPIAEQVKNFNEQIAKGHCKTWGVSNTPPAVLEQILKICEENGLQKPSAYQGDYNLVTRGMEKKLLPILRAHGMAYVAFRTIGSGFLSGNWASQQVEGTRFSDDNPLGKAMQRVYGGDELQQATRKFNADVQAQGLTSLEVALRWILHHSALGDEDAVILGASKESQLRESVSLVQKGPLPPAVLALVDDLWAAVEPTRGSVL